MKVSDWDLACDSAAMLSTLQGCSPRLIAVGGFCPDNSDAVYTNDFPKAYSRSALVSFPSMHTHNMMVVMMYAAWPLFFRVECWQRCLLRRMSECIPQDLESTALIQASFLHSTRGFFFSWMMFSFLVIRLFMI
jgi:hypothetical protein